jgi:hypothetical protein
VDSTSVSLLFTAATLMVTLAGFSILFLVIRQAIGQQLSAVDLFLTRAVITLLFTITAGALLPAVLGLYGIAASWVWKISALLFGVPMLTMLLTYRRRRIAATGKPPTLFGHVVLLGLGSTINLAMLVFVVGNFYNMAAVYITAVLVNFFILAFTFVHALAIIPREQVGGPASGIERV